MPMIQKQKTEVFQRLSIRLEAGLADRLSAYAEYLESSKDHVIAEMLKYVIGRDKDFARFLPQIPPTNVGGNPSRNGAKNTQANGTAL